MDKKVGETVYEKYLVTLPKEIVEKSNLVGKDLAASIQNGKIILAQA